MPLRAALRPLVAIAFLAALAAAAATTLGCAAQRANEPFSLVAVDDVQRMLSQPDVAVIDANPKEVFEKNHLPGARWYKSAPFAKVLPADKSARLVFYCAGPK